MRDVEAAVVGEAIPPTKIEVWPSDAGRVEYGTWIVEKDQQVQVCRRELFH